MAWNNREDCSLSRERCIRYVIKWVWEVSSPTVGSWRTKIEEAEAKAPELRIETLRDATKPNTTNNIQAPQRGT